MKTLSEMDRLTATGFAIAIGAVVHQLHTQGVIKCPGLDIDEPKSTFDAIAEKTAEAAINAIEEFAATQSGQLS